jgi:hypothetical protein
MASNTGNEATEKRIGIDGTEFQQPKYAIEGSE